MELETKKKNFMYYKRNFNIWPGTISGLMEDALHTGINRLNEEIHSFSVPVNIKETEHTYELHIIAAGLNKEDFKINMDQNILHITYEHKVEGTDQPQEGKWLRSEYKKRSFKRSFTLTDKVDSTNISAKYTDGVLVVNLPKKEVTEPTAQEIKVN